MTGRSILALLYAFWHEAFGTVVVPYAGDRGVGLASRLASYYPARLCGFATIAVSYTPPGMMFDIGM